MILFLLEVLMILLYMINGYLGLLVSSIIFIMIWANKKYNIENKIINSLILSIPVYNVGILGMKMHHVFSWYMIFLGIYIVYLIVKLLKKDYRLSKKYIFISIILFLILLINLFMKENISTAITDFIQISVMLISIILTNEAKESIKSKVKNINLEDWLNKINCTIMAMAICTIIQFVFYTITGKQIGFMTIFPKRIVYDVIFKGASVLSIILGIGIIINVNNIFLKRGKVIINVFNAILCFGAIVINSSRTGLAAALIIIVYEIMRNVFIKYKGSKLDKKKIFYIIFTIILLIVMAIGVYSAMKLTRQSEKIFGNNGRIKTYEDAITTISSNLNNFIFGSGLGNDNYNFAMPHNFILETIMKSGVIFTAIIIYLLVILLKYIKNNEYFKYIIWQILISSMFVTSFHEMTFIITYIIIALISTHIYNQSEEQGNEQRKEHIDY